ncbi:hypothetical protein M9H77_03723 [Catharanthus roseus]|uniref:Uncharacterized protein n=1 Tax=Catharanthus roseus TaxID=4058 RepID=A0ACC0CC75_CATRO|nr:hypothetical protein M9H77_03723 [Catharanthus roseus]
MWWTLLRRSSFNFKLVVDFSSWTKLQFQACGELSLAHEIYISPLQQNRKRALGKLKATCNLTTMNREFHPPKYVGAEEPFITLDVPDNLRKEIYLAAFPSCWIYKFLLLGKKIGYIYASVFKVSHSQTLQNVLQLWKSSAFLDTKSKVKLPNSTRTLPATGLGNSSKALEKTSALTIPEANPLSKTSNPTMVATGSQSSKTDTDRDHQTYEAPIMSLDSFLEGVPSQSFDALRSAACDMMTKEAYLESFSEVKRQLKEIASKDSIGNKQNELQKELDMLMERKQGICTSIRLYEEELKKVHTESWSKKEEVVAIENAPFQYDKVGCII